MWNLNNDLTCANSTPPQWIPMAFEARRWPQSRREWDVLPRQRVQLGTKSTGLVDASQNLGYSGYSIIYV